MDKNWLIRTKSNHILGPISKEKVLELYHNGSIKADDEVCSGNGFWFFIREDELVNKYLLGSDAQSFNPISEAKDVLTSRGDSTPHEEPSDITLIGALDLAKLKEPEVPPVPDHKAAPAPKPTLTTAQQETVSSESKKKITSVTIESSNQDLRQSEFRQCL